MANHHHQHHHQAHSQNSSKKTKVVVVMVPLPAQGHLNQLLQFSRLILSYNIPVHFVGTSTHNRQAKLRVQGWDPQQAPSTTTKIHFHDFEIPPFSSPPPNPNAKNKFPSHLLPAFYASKSNLREPVSFLLRSLACEARKVIVIHDSLMGSVVQEVQFIPNAESYTFRSVSAFTICLFHWEKKMGRNIKLNENIIPKDLPSSEGCFTTEFFEFMASEFEYFKLDSGCIYNTSRIIENPYMDLIEKNQEKEESRNIVKKKHWALGPFNPVTIFAGADEKRHLCLKWLDKQERNSVIYISFGTTTAMNNEQIKQLAYGLKQSNQKFIWVLRDADKGDVFKKELSERKAELPKGYEESIQEMGMVVRDWVPQLEILAHQAIGGFISHCGWNSCMESITMGVPIAAWPMHSDQPRNAVLITDILKIGIAVKQWSCRDEIVTVKMVENCVKRLMASDEGDGIRKRAAELAESLQQSMSPGGVSRLEIDSFISHISS